MSLSPTEAAILAAFGASAITGAVTFSITIYSARRQRDRDEQQRQHERERDADERANIRSERSPSLELTGPAAHSRSMDGPASPIILRSSWGHVEAEGLGGEKDVKLWPGGGRAWDWRETGTEHDPGIQFADVAELLAHGAEIVVLSRGRELRLRTDSSTLDELAEHRVDVRQDETQAAIETYNELAGRGLRVGGLFHSTC